jgi:hypothetical protein
MSRDACDADSKSDCLGANTCSLGALLHARMVLLKFLVQNCKATALDVCIICRTDIVYAAAATIPAWQAVGTLEPSAGSIRRLETETVTSLRKQQREIGIVGRSPSRHCKCEQQ